MSKFKHPIAESTMAYYQVMPSSFCMLCHGDSSELDIPKAFAEKHKKFLQQDWLSLKTRSEKRWKVKIIKNRSTDELQIKDGWSQFVNDNNLFAMTFLTFSIVGPASLQVSIFREDREEPPASPPPPSREPPPASPPPPSRIQSGQTWRIVKELKNSNIRQRLDIPSAFVQGAGIAAKQTFLLRYDQGEREVAMTDRNVMKYSFTRGWEDFLKYNRLKIGDILLFKFVGDNIIDVVVMEEEAGRNLIGQSRSGGFLEPERQM